MTREFLKGLGLEDAQIDSILDENRNEIGKEKQKVQAAEAAAKAAKTELETANGELETLRKSNGDVSAVQKQLSDLQSKYDTDTAALHAQLADRDYTDAINRAIADKGLKFSSAAAKRDFVARLKEKKLEIRDGALDGVDDFIKAQREADPDAFASDKPAPRIVTAVGAGGAPQEVVPANVAQAKVMGEARAASLKASGDVLKNYL